MAAAMTPDADGFVRDLMAPNLPLAGRCAVAPGVTVRDTLRAELRAALVARSRDPAADLRAHRCGAGARPLGDPRFERRTGPFAYLLPPLVTVAGGTYRVTAGTITRVREEIEVRLPTFAMGRFAVTNAEYQCFMDAGGYEDERWWEGMLRGPGAMAKAPTEPTGGCGARIGGSGGRGRIPDPEDARGGASHARGR